MLAQLTVTKTLPNTTHLLVLLPKSKTVSKDVVHASLLTTVFKRRAMKVDELAQCAVATGKQTGERLCAFPQDDDYETELDSKVADIKQCTLTSDADHILATRFLKRFVEHDTPWLHVDLSSSRCEGGLGIVASEVNGFGVAWGAAMLKGGH